MIVVRVGGVLLCCCRDADGRRGGSAALVSKTPRAVGGGQRRCGRFAPLTVAICISVAVRCGSTYFPGVIWVNGVRLRAGWLQFVRVCLRVVRVVM